MIPPAQFRAFCDQLKPDQLVELSHHNRAALQRAINAITRNGRIGLEIGCYKGETTRWLLEHGIDLMDVVDTFAGSPEFNQKPKDIEAAFRRTIAPVSHRVIKILKGPSARMLSRLDPKYSFIYIDGSHDSRDVILDAGLAWRVLEPGGVMVFDDYQWNYYDNTYRNPAPAIDFFLNAWSDDLVVLEYGYQVIIRKEK